MTVAAPSRIVLVRQGDTPIVNTALERVVQAAFPEHEVVDIDVLEELRRRPIVAACVIAGASLEHGVDLLRHRTDRKLALLTSAAFTRFVRRVVRSRVDPANTTFVLQSQSLFSADVPGVPHLVYTDHVHLANLGYPGFDRRRLLPSSCLRREVDLYKRCAAILVRSTNIRDTLVHGYGIDPDRVDVIGVGPNAPVSRATEVPRPWHGGRIVFVGVDWERKGGPVLLEAFARVRAAHPSARLEIVGPARPLVASAGVTFHGRLRVAEVASLLEHADVFCLPTRAEPFGVVFIEAMLAGLAVVGTRLGAQPDFIIPGRTGELVPPDDPDALASALCRLVGDDERTRRMGRCAAELADERYSWPVVGARLRAAVETALERAGGREDRHGGARPLRVAHVIVGFRVDGGAERVVRTLLTEMRRHPLESSLIILKPAKAGNLDELRHLDCGLVELPARRLVDPVRFVRLVRALRRGRFDVVHTHLADANILGVVAARLLRIPTMVTLHSTHSDADDHWYHGRLERFVLRRIATTVIAVGHETALAQARRIGRTDIVVLPNAVVPAEPIGAATRRDLRREIMTDPSRRLLLTVGRLEPPKAHDDLVDAFAELVQGRPDVELAIVGRGSLRGATEALVERHGLGDRVHFLGVRGDVTALMQAADLFALSSRWEGLPMVLLEAMACRLPIVSTDVGDVASLLGETPSRIVPPDQPRELAASLVEALAELDADRDLTTAGAELVRCHYSSAAWADAVFQSYVAAVTA